MSQRFGEIRSLLNESEQGPRTWTLLCELVDGFAEGELDQMVFPYVAGHVRHWDPRACVAPREWVYRALRGENLPFWSMVRALDLSQEYLDSSQLQTLLSSDRMQQIEVVNLESNRIGAAGAQYIAEAEHLGELEELRLGFNHLKLAGMVWLCRAGALDRLRHLHIQDNSLGESGTLAMLRADWLSRLETLVIARNELTAQALERLLNRLDESRCLKRLVLDFNAFSRSEGACRKIAQGLEQLEELEMRSCALTAEQSNALARWSRWPHLRKLDLSRNPLLDDVALGVLLGSGECPVLERVYLGGTSANVKIYEALLSLPSLRYVELPDSMTPDTHWDALLERGVSVKRAR